MTDTGNPQENSVDVGQPKAKGAFSGIGDPEETHQGDGGLLLPPG